MRKDNSPLRPFLKWAGGKRQLLTEIIKQLPESMDTYYEPFAGAGAVFFALQPRKAIINDCNIQLMLTYNAIRENVEEVILALKNHERKNTEQYYYEIRNLDRDPAQFSVLSKTEKAARIIYLNKTCYNGLYRVNAKDNFNVPYGKYKNPGICEEALLRRVSEYLNYNEVTIMNDDFEQAVSQADKDSFIYFDPPYHSPKKNNFTGYQPDGFDEKEQERLRNVLLKLTKRGVRCLLSNSDTAFIRELYNGDFFDIVSVQAIRAINSDSAGRGKVNEVLIKNWKE